MSSDSTTPTVVLVHGAFADASSWARVMPRLLDAGVSAQAIVNPLRGLTVDGEYVASVLAQTDGPVVLVGHSYGGPVITYASSKAHNVKALVYVASFGLDEGVTTNGSGEGFPPSDLPPALRPLFYPNGGEPGTEYYIDPELFPEVFAADLPVEEAKVLAYSQRPASGIGFGEPLAVTPGWKKTPSWFIVATADRAINPDSERAAAQRMGATMSEIDGGSHAIALSQPDQVTAVILEALQSISEPSNSRLAHRVGRGISAAANARVTISVSVGSETRSTAGAGRYRPTLKRALSDGRLRHTPLSARRGDREHDTHLPAQSARRSRTWYRGPL